MSKKNSGSRRTSDKPYNSLLKFISTIAIWGTKEIFVAKEKFVRGVGRRAKVKISYLGENFTAWFLAGDGKIENQADNRLIRYYRLCRSSRDIPIIRKWGGEEKSKTTLFELFSLMEKQGEGEDGVLLNNGYSNIFYILDQNGVLRVVRVLWEDGGWHIRAYPIGHVGVWARNWHVFA